MQKLYIFLSLLLFIPFYTQAQTYVVSGGTGTPYEYGENLAGTGIEKIYLLNNLSNASISFTSSALSVNFYRYSSSLSDKELIPDSDISISSTGNTATYNIRNLRDGYGYLAEENGGTKAAIWIIDYSLHQPLLSSIEAIEGDDRCEYLKLYITKSDELYYRTVSGSRRDIPRLYTISYDNLVWNEGNRNFTRETVTLPAREIGTEIVIDAPLMDTSFKITGDQFARHFNIAKEINSTTYKAVAVQGYIVPEQQSTGMGNEEEEGTSTLGGSAPVTINFYGYANEPVAHYYTWFIYNNKDMNNYIARYTDRDISYKFEYSGDYTVKLEVADLTSACLDTTSVSLNISESWLEVPNYFSPFDSPGYNDEFKVAYKSLIKFKGTIFNRWGTKLYEWTDPAGGWDGKYKGRYVNTGVYFYVITAEGSDGIKYKKSGDINILRSR